MPFSRNLGTSTTLPPDAAERVASLFADKVVLVTGGTGSIGREIVNQTLKLSPKAVRVFSRGEEKQFLMQSDLGDRSDVRFLIGDVRDGARVSYAMKDVDIVIHAAAMKHVPASEYNPMEAVKTNVDGTQNVIMAALERNVPRFTLISTDKVVNPVNTMGATKLLAEKLVVAANRYRGSAKTAFSVVRFGNVMGSSGSVIPLFASQISQGKDLTLTDPAMTRFIMTIPTAANLVLSATARASEGDTFVLKMPTVHIKTMAQWLIDDYAAAGHVYAGKLVTSGARPGEQLHERLMTTTEAARAWEDDHMYLIPPEGLPKRQVGAPWNPAAEVVHSSHLGQTISRGRFLRSVHELGIVPW